MFSIAHGGIGSEAVLWTNIVPDETASARAIVVTVGVVVVDRAFIGLNRVVIRRDDLVIQGSAQRVGERAATSLVISSKTVDVVGEVGGGTPALAAAGSITTPPTATRRPVGGIPMKVPWCVP